MVVGDGQALVECYRFGYFRHQMHFSIMLSVTCPECCIRTYKAIDKFCERRILEYTRLFLNETENVEKANPIIYALFCAVGIPANVLIIIGIAISHRFFDQITPYYMGHIIWAISYDHIIWYWPCNMAHTIWVELFGGNYCNLDYNMGHIEFYCELYFCSNSAYGSYDMETDGKVL